MKKSSPLILIKVFKLENNKPFVFVLMPFDKIFDDVYNLGIKGAVEQSGMFCQRVDEQIFHQENILTRIYNQINTADVIVADMTGRNPNVFYEVGYAHAKGKVCILLTNNSQDIPFDLKHHRHLVYSSVSHLKDQLTSDLKHVLVESEQPIVVSLNSIEGDLEKTEYTATAIVTISFDMQNKTDTQSPDIETIYFYTGKGWSFSQDGQECISTKSDMPEFGERHFIKSPVSRIGRKGWVPLKLIGKKVMGRSWIGDELQDSYDLNGFALMKVRTSYQDFLSRIELKVIANTIPF